jgi:peptidyl-prolyl cis-trans isomerase SurA
MNRKLEIENWKGILSGLRSLLAKSAETYVILCSILTFTIPMTVRAELIDRVVAAVNNEVITLSDLQQAVAFNAALGGKGNGKQLEQETLEGLINGRLLLQEAYRLRFTEVSEQDIAAEVGRLKQRLGSDDAYRSFLDRTGLTEERLSRMLGERMLIERFVEKKIGLFARVNRDEAQSYFQDHPKEFQDKRFAQVQKPITALLSAQKVSQQLDLYVVELRDRAVLRLNPLREEEK